MVLTMPEKSQKFFLGSLSTIGVAITKEVMDNQLPLSFDQGFLKFLPNRSLSEDSINYSIGFLDEESRRMTLAV
jgi:hypothetical protein